MVVAISRGNAMLMAVVVYGAAYVTAKALSDKLPSGFGFSLLAVLATILASFLAGIAAAFAISSAVEIGANDIVASALINATIAALIAPFAVWYMRRKRPTPVSD
jgi:hypothetical protein